MKYHTFDISITSSGTINQYQLFARSATQGEAKALTIRQESNQPLQLTSGKWVHSYKLPEKVELPYSTMVVTDRNLHYLITLRKIDFDGIKITYQKLRADEARHYLPSEK